MELQQYDLRYAFGFDDVAGAPESPLLSTPDAANYLGRSEDFVRRVLRYEIPVVQHGARGPLAFFKTDLDRWLATNTRVPVR